MIAYDFVFGYLQIKAITAEMYRNVSKYPIHCC